MNYATYCEPHTLSLRPFKLLVQYFHRFLQLQEIHTRSLAKFYGQYADRP